MLEIYLFDIILIVSWKDLLKFIGIYLTGMNISN